MLANYFILNSFLMAASNAKCYANVSIVELDRSINRNRKKLIEIKENADTLLEIDAL